MDTDTVYWTTAGETRNELGYGTNGILKWSGMIDSSEYFVSGRFTAGLHSCWEVIHVVIQHSEEL